MRKVYNLVGGHNLLFSIDKYTETEAQHSFTSTRNSARLTFNSKDKDKILKELKRLVDAIKHCGYSDSYRTGLGHLHREVPSCYGNNWQVSDIKKVITVLEHNQLRDLKELSRDKLKEKLNSYSIAELEDVINDIQQG